MVLDKNVKYCWVDYLLSPYIKTVCKKCLKLYENKGTGFAICHAAITFKKLSMKIEFQYKHDEEIKTENIRKNHER